MMTLDDAVDLVLFAFENGRPGDIFVQKAPAATIEVLAKALLELYHANNPSMLLVHATGKSCMKPWLTVKKLPKPRTSENITGYRLTHVT